MPAPAYHSALRPPVPARICFAERFGDSYAFVHDLFDRDFPDVYDTCDVFYTDLPWSHGFAEFERRAGVAQERQYASFLARVGAIVATRNIPTVLVTGRQSLRYLPEPMTTYPTHLNGAPAVALAYGLTLTDTEDAVRVLEDLAQRFQCVGDFCCGYGRTARVFHRAGKRFVVSDYNPECIGYLVDYWRDPLGP